jgi:ribosomal protein S12 methylthiotransferase
MKRIYLEPLGCPKNTVDAEILLADFSSYGFQSTDSPEDADLILVNTCSFIKSAKEESIQTILELAEQYEAPIVVTGCLSQRYPELHEQFPEVKGWLCENSPQAIEKLLKDLGYSPLRLVEKAARVPVERGISAYLKIAEGCNRHCAFCSIPNFKGELKSRQIDHLLSETESLLQQGIKEINVVAQDTASYGLDLWGGRPGEHLDSLLKELSKTQIPRIRVLYLYPLVLPAKFYETLAENPKICNYIDMPFQHASGKLLKAMKRFGNASDYLAELNTIRSIFENKLAIRSAVITGFPGESEEDFKILKDFVRAARFDWFACFSYSKEEETDAFQMEPQVHHMTIKKRQRQIEEIYHEQRLERPSQVGETLQVLVEETTQEGVALARSEFQAPEIDGLIYLSQFKGKPGDIVKAKITAESDFDQEAQIIE